MLPLGRFPSISAISVSQLDQVDMIFADWVSGPGNHKECPHAKILKHAHDQSLRASLRECYMKTSYISWQKQSNIHQKSKDPSRIYQEAFKNRQYLRYLGGKQHIKSMGEKTWKTP